MNPVLLYHHYIHIRFSFSVNSCIVLVKHQCDGRSTMAAVSQVLWCMVYVIYWSGVFTYYKNFPQRKELFFRTWHYLVSD